MDDDAYLQQFLEAAGPRLQWLREQSAQTGGPAPEQLDFTRDSLVPLWASAAPRFRRLRDGDQPEPGPKPVWFHGAEFACNDRARSSACAYAGRVSPS